MLTDVACWAAESEGLDFARQADTLANNPEATAAANDFTDEAAKLRPWFWALHYPCHMSRDPHAPKRQREDTGCPKSILK